MNKMLEDIIEVTDEKMGVIVHNYQRFGIKPDKEAVSIYNIYMLMYGQHPKMFDEEKVEKYHNFMEEHFYKTR